MMKSFILVISLLNFGLVISKAVETPASEIDTHNVIDVPSNCPPGSYPDENGKCREEWFRKTEVEIPRPNDGPISQTEVLIKTGIDGKNVIDVPPNCPPGFYPDQNGICREEWFRKMPVVIHGPNDGPIIETAAVIDAPPNCPPGFYPDQNGICREPWSKF